MASSPINPVSEGERLRETVEELDWVSHLSEEPEAIGLELVDRRGGETDRRIRLEAIERSMTSPGIVEVEVALGWRGERFIGRATGEATLAIELRTAANATVEAIQALLGAEAGLRLIGIKQIRAFDAELVITSINRSEPPQRSFVGAAIVGTDPLRSASASVLHALNRMLGNFLLSSK